MRCGGTFNLKKCNVLRVSRSNSAITFKLCCSRAFYSLEVSHHPYLGIELTSNLSWTRHIEIITEKANQTLAFLRRNLGNCPQIVKKRAYKSLIRPHLEYASSVWDPYLTKDILELEKGTAQISTMDYSRSTGVVKNLLELGWVPLQRRRLNII